MQDLVKDEDFEVTEIVRDALCVLEYEEMKAYMPGNYDDKELQEDYKQKKKVRYSYLGETNHQNWRLGFRHGMVPGSDEPGVSGQPQFVRMLVLPRFVGHQNQMEQFNRSRHVQISKYMRQKNVQFDIKGQWIENVTEMFETPDGSEARCRESAFKNRTDQMVPRLHSNLAEWDIVPE